MTNRIRVQVADAGRRVPIEGRRGAYHEHEVVHDVRNTPFIQRRIAEGDLIEVPAETADASATAPIAPSPIAPPTKPATLPIATPDTLSGSTTAAEKGA
jgi:hypothetical protein